MTRSLFCLFVLSASLLAADPADSVREASSVWRQAVIKQDRAALERVLAEGLTYTHANGRSQTKAEYIADITKGPPRYEAFTESETKVRIYGDTALLTGFVDVKLLGRPSYRVRTMEIYVRNGGRWQLADKMSARITS